MRSPTSTDGRRTSDHARSDGREGPRRDSGPLPRRGQPCRGTRGARPSCASPAARVRPSWRSNASLIASGAVSPGNRTTMTGPVRLPGLLGARSHESRGHWGCRSNMCSIHWRRGPVDHRHRTRRTLRGRSVDADQPRSARTVAGRRAGAYPHRSAECRPPGLDAPEQGPP